MAAARGVRKVDENRPRFDCRTVRPSRRVPGLAEDARKGLMAESRCLPPKYFYDDRGSRLFDQICDTPEYYPTRTEAGLLEAHAEAIVRVARPDHILELGSGTSRKTRHLFDACEALGAQCSYWPFDVCEAMLREAGEQLMREYPWLNIRALVGDYLAGLDHFPNPHGRRLFVFLGGTIGNFDSAQAQAFLREVRTRMRPGDGLLLGADRVKDKQVLHEAYNDAQGVTAAFNLNVLRVLNGELQGDFDLDAFSHNAHYNEAAQQIEMYLVARRAHTVRLEALGHELHFDEGERILTEISRKFRPRDLTALLASAGMEMKAHFEPDNGYFSLVLANPV